MRRKIGLLIVLFGSIVSCKSSTDYKEIRVFKQNEWKIADRQTFTFSVADTLASHHFNYLVRATTSYPFYNLYLQQKLIDSTGKVLSQTLDEILLFNEKTGKPYGSGAAEIIDYRIKAPQLQNVKFHKTGQYRWVVSHNMRPDPLRGIMSIGAEVIKNK